MRSAAIATALLASTFSVFNVSASTPTLNVYTYDSFVSEWGPGPQLKSAFEAQCSCVLNFVAAEDGVSILNRARIEKSATEADVLLGLDLGLIQEASELGLVQTHQVDTSALKSELSWSSAEFVPFDYGHFAFIYDSRKISSPAASLDELIRSDASLIYQDPRTSTPGQGMMLWVNAAYGDQSATAWREIADNTETVTKGWWEAYSLFLEGGADYVLSYTTSPAYHVVAEGVDHYKAAAFSEGHIAQVEVAGISAYTDQAELANEFLRFLISPEAQAIIPVTNWMLPVIDGVELPEIFDNLVTPTTLGFSPAEIAANRKGWINEWRDAAAN